jgi:peroxiredoxin
MKKIIFCLFLIWSQFLSSKEPGYGIPVANIKVISNNFNSFLSYYTKYIKLSDDFVGLDVTSKIIDKKTFLNKISTGFFFPMRLTSERQIYIKLIKINNFKTIDISNTLKQYANSELKHFEMEGKKIPKFNFKDLNGKIYNSKTTKGKIVVLKFWFINCQKCVEEMPNLNKLLQKYKDRNDIVFLSLAFDKNEQLSKFLKKKAFFYPVVGNQKKYLLQDLKIESYPTHMIINNKGLITKVVNSYEELDIALRKEISK